MTPHSILSAEGIEKSYGGVRALRGARLEIAPGEVHALAGENGCGKSTLLKILSGQVSPDAGRIELDGERVTFASPTEALHRGIATVTQETTLVPEISIAENVFLGRRVAGRRGFVRQRDLVRRAVEALERLGLDIDPALPVKRLRPDEQQMVEIARALAVDSRVLILDEPTSSLTDDEVGALFGIVRKLREQDVAVIFVSHRMPEVYEIADRVTVLRDGITVGVGSVAEIPAGRLVELMVGKSLEDVAHASSAELQGEPVLDVRELSLPGAFQDVTLAVAPGEIVGLAGLVGAGRSELLESIFGLRAPSGTIRVSGDELRAHGARDAVRAGLAFVPPDRKRQGLVMQMSVHQNLVMAASSRRPRAAVPDHGAERRAVGEAVDTLRIRTHSTASPVSTLSGGNQQKVVLGKWLATEPRVLMLDEPTRGVDVGAKAEIYRLLRDAASRGIGILVSSSENPELLTLCDRVLVMFRGRVVASLGRTDATEAAIAHLAGGHS